MELHGPERTTGCQTWQNDSSALQGASRSNSSHEPSLVCPDGTGMAAPYDVNASIERIEHSAHPTWQCRRLKVTAGLDATPTREGGDSASNANSELMSPMRDDRYRATVIARGQRMRANELELTALRSRPTNDVSR